MRMDECMKLDENVGEFYFFVFSFSFVTQSQLLYLLSLNSFILKKKLFLEMRNVANPEVNVKIGYY